MQRYATVFLILVFSLFFLTSAIAGQSYKIIFPPAVQDKNQLFEGDSVEFVMFGKIYSLTIKDVDEQNKIATVNVGGRDSKLNLGQGTIYDFDKDGRGDLAVNFTAFNFGEIVLRLEDLELSQGAKLVEEPAETAEQEQSDAQNEQVKEPTTETTGFIIGSIDKIKPNMRDLIEYIIIGLVILIIILLVVKRTTIFRFTTNILKSLFGLPVKIVKKIFKSGSLKAPSPPKIAGHATCRKCSSSISAKDRFCYSCGARIVREQPKRFCARCNAEIKHNAKFCSECGREV